MSSQNNNNKLIQYALQLLEKQSQISEQENQKEKSVDLSQMIEMHEQEQQVFQTPPKQPANSPRVLQSVEPCNCHRSGCQKMYCECLAKGRLCSEKCRCTDCHNRQQNVTVLNVLKELEHNKQRKRFRSYRFKDGCTCQKSQCQKKYCECYQSGRLCGEGCRCLNCENGQETNLNGQRRRKKVRSIPISQSSTYSKNGSAIVCKEDVISLRKLNLQQWNVLIKESSRLKIISFL